MSDRQTDELVAIAERGIACVQRGTLDELARRLVASENDRRPHARAGRGIEAAACAIREQALREAIAIVKGQTKSLPLRAWVKAGRYTATPEGEP